MSGKLSLINLIKIQNQEKENCNIILEHCYMNVRQRMIEVEQCFNNLSFLVV